MAKRSAPPTKKAAASSRQTSEVKEHERVKDWVGKIRAAEKRYEEWEKEFEVKQGEDYFKGRQWHGVAETEAAKRYVINLVLAAVETQRPSLLFDNPQIRVEPRPSRKDQMSAQVLQQEAKLAQQAVQTFIDDPDVKFMLETSLAVQEAHFRFAIVEVGYSADYLDNPHAGKPVLPSTKAMNAGEDDSTDAPAAEGDAPADPGPLQPERVVKPGTENIYVRRISAKHFRVSLSGKNDLSANDFVCYYEWAYVSDLKKNRKYRTTDDLKSTGVIDKKYRDSATIDVDAKHGMVKIWKVWDLRAKVKHVLADGHKTFLLEGEAWKTFPFADLKFIELTDEYYPLPLVTNWLGPQDELNEQRETGRVHRRRFYRRYTAVKGSIDQEELDKLETGGDGVTAWANKDINVVPVQDAPLDGSIWRQGAQAEMDFTMVSGVSGEQRQVATADTATQASIMDARTRLRESAARIKVANWLGRIGRLMLLAMREHMTLPFLIKEQVDQQTANPQEVLQAALLWKEITAKDLGDMDMDVSVSIETLSPVAQDAERISWNQVLALLSNPAILVLLTSSETLMRKTLALYGISSEHEVQEIKKVATGILMMQQMQSMAAAAMPAGPKASGAARPGSAGAAQVATPPQQMQ